MRAVTRGRLLVSLLALGACSPSFTAPDMEAENEAAAVPSYDMVFDPLDPNRVTYTFDELDSSSCQVMMTTSGLYEDLGFPSPAQMTACVNPNGTVGLRPSGISGTTAEVLVGLPRGAEWVSIQSFMLMFGNAPTLVAYDATGAEIDRSSNGTLFSWSTLNVDGAGTEIASVGLLMPQWAVDLDNLTVQYVPQPGPDPDPDPDPTPGDPVTKADCVKGGWAAFGFRNQGQCVRFVETGKDSR